MVEVLSMGALNIRSYIQSNVEVGMKGFIKNLKWRTGILKNIVAIARRASRVRTKANAVTFNFNYVE